jgi:hypothetical protein
MKTSPEYTCFLVNSEYDVTPQLIKKVESMFRQSYENRMMIATLKETEYSYTDLLFEDYDLEGKAVTVDYHHPFHLFNIVKVAIIELLDKNKNGNISTGQILDKVIEYHYRNIIPYVFLARTTHELHHSGDFIIDAKYIHGNYKTFIKEKYKYFDADDKKMIKENLFIDVDKFIEEIAEEDENNE